MNPNPQAPLVLRDDTDGVARLTLNRPRQFNALSLAMLNALESELMRIACDEQVRVVVIAAAGPAFCPGHDLKEMLAERSQAFIAGLFEKCCRIMMSLTKLPQPVIARVHGTATAAGCQLVAACDLAIAAEEARFATSGINYGLFCATPGVPVSRSLSRKHALEMLLTGEFIDAGTALQWGLINKVVPLDQLDQAVQHLAKVLAAKPRTVLASGKQFFYRQIEQSLSDAYRDAAAVITSHMLGDAGLEGVSAFVEKRKPNFGTA